MPDGPPAAPRLDKRCGLETGQLGRQLVCAFCSNVDGVGWNSSATLPQCLHRNHCTAEQRKVLPPTVTEELEPLTILLPSGLPCFALDDFPNFPLVQNHTHGALVCTSQTSVGISSRLPLS